MKKLFLAVWVLALLQSAAYADAVVTASPGPDSTTRVHSSWGDFIVNIDDGGNIWIGTEAEWLHAKAIGAATANGFREIDRGDREKNGTYFASKAAPILYIGKLELSSIYALICQQCRPDKKMGRTDIAPSDHYVVLIWEQSRAAPSSAVLIDRKTQKSMQRLNCMADQDPHSRRCQYVLPANATKDPMLAIFTLENQTPAAVPFGRLAVQ